MTLDSSPIAKRILRNGRSGAVSGKLRALGSRRIDDLGSPRGYGSGGRRAPAPPRRGTGGSPKRTAMAAGLSLRAARARISQVRHSVSCRGGPHIELAAGPTPASSLLLGPRLRRPPPAILAFWRPGHLEVHADLSGEIPVDLVVPGNRRNLLGRPVDVEGVVPALAKERAPVLGQVPQQVPALHAVTVMGSLMTAPPPASSRAISRLASITKATASRRFVRASSREAPWLLAPGNSSMKAM